MKLIHQAASEAAASRSPALAQTLVAAVTDVADLAAALPPKARAREMQVCFAQSQCSSLIATRHRRVLEPPQPARSAWLTEQDYVLA